MCGLLAAAFEESPEETRKSTMVGSREECLERIAAYADVGVRHFIFMVFTPYFVEEMQAFIEEVAPEARRL